YACFVKSAELVTTPGDVVEYKTLCDTIQQQGPSTYAWHFVGVQDWATGGLSLFLWTNAGATARCVVNAHGKTAAVAATTPGFDSSVVLVEGSYGGEAGAWAEYDIELPCTARPTLLTSAPTSELASEEAGDQLALDAAAA